jgi:hemolysin activation/secretion protein
LRGYREVRFLAPVVGLVNLELRSRLYDFKFAKQHIGLGLTPFLDMGSVWDTFGEMDLKNIRATPGIGGRIAWNQSTILRLDFARSPEGSQFFFGFGHIF